ncbi:MAG TPA: hypothetical protein VN902_03090 [Candidatus Acidoferrales bacterium]|nr:hypothetical protein [Candidatus Acidoferrales bacterium]
MDEYGRTPDHPDYKNKEQHDREWKTFQQVKKEWAKKRKGRSVAHVEKFSGNDDVGDKMMRHDLDKTN